MLEPAHVKSAPDACVVCIACEATTTEQAALFVLAALATTPETWVEAALCERHQRELLAVLRPWPAPAPACGQSKAPPGWTCTRDVGHEGPCAAHELGR